MAAPLCGGGPAKTNQEIPSVINMAAALSKYMGRMGVRQGLRLYLLSKLAREQFAVRLPDYSRPIWVRPKTSDRNMFSDVLLEREYDLPIEPPPKFIIDAGANVGYTSLFMATRHPTARVIAIEPEESNFAQLQRNVSHLPQVTPVKGGLWPREAYLYVENPHDVKSGFRLGESPAARTGSIRATTVSALMKQFGVEQIDICKIDVEGAECEIFSDPACHEWLARTRMLIIELHDRFRPDSSAIVDRALAQHPHSRETRGDNVVFRLHSS